jgi:hypothetical protein
MLDALTVLLALLAVLTGPHWLLRCMVRAARCDASGEPLSALAWTLAAVLGAYLLGLALLVLLIAVARQAPTASPP